MNHLQHPYLQAQKFTTDLWESVEEVWEMEKQWIEAQGGDIIPHVSWIPQATWAPDLAFLSLTAGEVPLVLSGLHSHLEGQQYQVRGWEGERRTRFPGDTVLPV